MTEDVGPLIATGRAADVYAYGDGLVLRRYRTAHDCTYEAEVMKHVAAHGYPVPKIVSFSGPDLVMERVDGPTMLDDFGKHPWRVFAHTATLAGLLKRLHEIPAPDWLVDKLGGGAAIVHLDLHPDNVMLSSRGPVVIDWTNAGRGHPDAELADLWLVLSCAVIPGSRVERVLLGAGRKLLVGSLMRHFEKDDVRAHLAAAAEHRSRDRNMSDIERERMRRMVEREGR